MYATKFTKEEALNLLETYNKEPFHILHGLTVGEVLRWYAGELGYGDEADFWEIAGLLHDIDFEQYPEEHCKKAPELLESAGVAECLPCSSGDQVRRLLQRQAQAPRPAAPNNQFDQLFQIHLAGHGWGQIPLAQLLQGYLAAGVPRLPKGHRPHS